jgi:hypothetical protein
MKPWQRVRKPLLFIGMAFFAALTAWLLVRESEPSYDKKRLSEWLDLYQQDNPDAAFSLAPLMRRTSEPSGFFAYRDGAGAPKLSKNSEQARHAIKAIGRKAIPALLSWLEYHPPRWKDNLQGALRRTLPDELNNSKFVASVLARRREQLILSAGNGFAVLGEEAAAAIPRLTQLALTTNSPEAAARATIILAYMGEKGLPSLLRIASEHEAVNRVTAIRCLGALGYLGTNAAPAVPVLVSCAKDGFPVVARSAVTSLGWLRLEPALVVPVLTNSLADPSPELRHAAIIALGRFGPAARPAVPALRNMEGDDISQIRLALRRSLERIEPQSLPANAEVSE